MPIIDISPAPICSQMTLPPFPTLPTGFSIGAAIPGIGHVFDAKLCCKIFQLPVGLPPISIGVSVSLPFIAALNSMVGVVNAYLDRVPLLCPKE